MEEITYKMFIKNPREHPTLQLCPVCKGHRGEVLKEMHEETGESLVRVITCTLCLGRRLIPTLGT